MSDKKSGAQRRREDLDQARLLVAKHGYEIVKAGQKLPALSRKAQKVIDALGAPPNEPDDQLVWGRVMLAKITWLIATGEIDVGRARAIKDSVFAMGATHNRGALEQQVKQLKTMFAERRAQTNFVYELPGDKIVKPPTARGQYRPGPRDPGRA